MGYLYYVDSMNYSRNHQLYLAERLMWMDRHVNKTSTRALMKILCYNTSEEGSEDKKMCKVLVAESLMQYISNLEVLNREGFFDMNMVN